MNQSQLEQTNVLINECADQIFKFSPQLSIRINMILVTIKRTLSYMRVERYHLYLKEHIIFLKK